MATILSPDKALFSLEQADYEETARYLGYSKISLPDNVVSSLIKECCSQMFEYITPKAVYDCFDLSFDSQNPLLINFADITIKSEALSRNLSKCTKTYIFAATIGPQVDALIRKTQKLDSVKASVFQAAGAMFVEKVVECVNQEIKKITAEQGKNCKPRFSPGYGDVSLEVQKDFFRLLPCSKIGLTLMDTLIMAPEKSVTAFIGVQ